MKSLVICLVLSLFATMGWSKSKAPFRFNFVTETKIDHLVAAMTLEEKVRMIGGNEFSTFPLARLGIPALQMSDGPVGVRHDEQKTTAFPSGISMAASFNPELVGQVAAAIAEEARFFDRRMLLGPCVNLTRHPFGGRNFESFGEDPHLSSALAASYVKGVQSQHVIATVKHLVANDQEADRMTIDARVDLRTLFEIYLPPFEAAVEAGSWSVMSAYNRINGFYASENRFLLNDVLKNFWQFPGFVVSDWTSVHGTLSAAYNGLDLEMPVGLYFNSSLIEHVRSGHFPEELLDDKIRRILRAQFAIGLIDGPALPAAQGPESAEHKALALKLAQESVVLLKNENGNLPLQNIKKLAVIGPNANAINTGGGGSSHVNPTEVVTPLQGLRQRLGSAVEIRYARGAKLPGELEFPPAVYFKPELNSFTKGLRADFFPNSTLEGDPAWSRIDTQINLDYFDAITLPLRENFSLRWQGYVYAPVSGKYKFTTMSDDGVRLWIQNQLLIDRWDSHLLAEDFGEIELEAGQWYPLRLEFYQSAGMYQIRLGWQIPGDQELQEAIAAAHDSDAAVIFAGISDLREGEGFDRPTLSLPPEQIRLIEEVSRANPKTSVVLISGGQFLMGEFQSFVPSVLQLWYPGQYGGLAIADVLLGRVNPSGKLPMTYVKAWEDSPAFGNYPGQNGRVEYLEGILVGYRHFDLQEIEPEYPFGHGLSYTNFEYSNLQVHARSNSPGLVQLEFEIQNVGPLAGADVAQVYIGEENPTLLRPLRELKAFRKIFLKPQEKVRVQIDLSDRSFAFFDVARMDWKTNPGTYKVWVGSSSRNLPLELTIDLEHGPGSNLGIHRKPKRLD